MGEHHLHWPDSLRPTRLRKIWFERFVSLDHGLTLRELSARMGQPYASVAFWAKCFKYPFSKLARGRKSLIDWDTADWSRKNCELAQLFGVSGERVRQIRQLRNLPPAQKQTDGGRRFREYVAANRRRLPRMSIRRMIIDAGAGISTATAYEILKKAGVKLRSHVIPWPKVNWDLSDAELAAAWGTHSSYVARMRARAGGGPARWNGQMLSPAKELAYHRAVVSERVKAKQAGRVSRTAIQRKPRAYAAQAGT